MKYLSVCAVLRNEGSYLKEWIEHYLKEGVEHFYLYDNESTDEPKKTLKSFTDKKLITWFQTKGLRQQRVAYNHTIREHSEVTEWCAFFDIDEFGFSTAHKTLAEAVRAYDTDNSGLAIHWLLFGSNGHETYSDKLVVKRFTRRADCVNPHVKSIMRLKDTYSMNLDPHSFVARRAIIDENHKVMPRDYAIDTPATADVLRLQHYVTKSKEEYAKRKLLPDANSGQIKEFEAMWQSHDVNDVEDRTLADKR